MDKTNQSPRPGSSIGKESLQENGDSSQSGVLQLWWGVIQDQLGALTKEVESIRIANSESVSHQFDALKLRSRAQDEKMMESMNLIAQISQELKTVRPALQACEEKVSESMNVVSRIGAEVKTFKSVSLAQEEKIMESMRLITQLGQELKSVKLTVQVEKEECLATCSRLSDVLKGEPVKRAEQHEDVQQSIAQMRDHLAEEVRTRQHILDRQGDKLSQILNAFRNDVQMELDESRSAVTEVAQHLATLRESVLKENQELTGQINASRESLGKLAGEIDDWKQHQVANQTSFEAISHDMARMRYCIDEQGKTQQQQHEDLLEKFQNEFTKHAENKKSISSNLDDELYQKLQLQGRVVSRQMFLDETRRIWETINTEPPLKELCSQMKGLLQKDAVIAADFQAETRRLNSLDSSRQRHSRSRDVLKAEPSSSSQQPSLDSNSNSRSSTAEVRTASPSCTSSNFMQPPETAGTSARRVPSSPLRVTPHASSLCSPRRSVSLNEAALPPQAALPPRLSSQPGIGQSGVLTPRAVQSPAAPSHLLHSSTAALSIKTRPASTTRMLN